MSVSEERRAADLERRRRRRRRELIEWGIFVALIIFGTVAITVLANHHPRDDLSQSLSRADITQA